MSAGCDPKCGCGYYSTEKDIHSQRGVEHDTAVVHGSPYVGLQACREKCGARDGCTSFKYSDKLCVTFTDVIKNKIHGLSETPSGIRHITTCLRSMIKYFHIARIKVVIMYTIFLTVKCFAKIQII